MEQDSEILIISDESEKSTDQVLKYLLYYDAKFIRINGSDIIEKIEIIFDEKEEIQLVCKDVELNFNKVKSSWYRRGKINLLPVGHYQKMNGDEMQFYGQYLEHYGKELKGILTFIHNSLKSRKQINSIHDNDISKLSQLSLAKSCGLKIPFTIFSNNIENILKQYEPNIFIVKAINFHVFRLNVNNCKWICGANSSELIDNEIDFQKYSGKNILISCFQKYVAKKIEIRTFFLLGKFYSMAIFSQQNEKTKIDFRHYDFERPNRTVPFKLPVVIEKRIERLMRKLKLSSGSLDIIYTLDGEYIFLEVNPIGQFDWLARSCNYPIEKQIAKELIDGIK